MNASPEMLIGFMFFLLVLILLLLALLIRGMKKGSAEKQPEISGAVEESASAHSDGGPPAASSHSATEEGLAHSLGAQIEATESGMRAPGGSPAATTASQAPGLAASGAIPLMQVWRDQDGCLVIVVEGLSYRRLFEIRDGAVGRRVLDTINQLVVFSEGQDSRAGSLEPSTAAAISPSETPFPTTTAADPPSDAFFEDLRIHEEPPTRVPRLTADPVPFRRASATNEPNITLNLAEEIERLLQERLNVSPEFRQRYVHVASAPDGALRFDVDGARYSALDAIPDVQIQALIRAAIADWERKR